MDVGSSEDGGDGAQLFRQAKLGGIEEKQVDKVVLSISILKITQKNGTWGKAVTNAKPSH